MRASIPAAAPGWLVLALILALVAMVGWLAWPHDTVDETTHAPTRPHRAPSPDGGLEQVDIARTTTTVRASRAKNSPGAALTVRPAADFGPRAPGGATPTDAQLDALAGCESGGDPQAVSASGTYRGAFQWSQRSWDNHVARLGRYLLIGVDPATFPYEVQRDITRAVPLSAWARQWPHCSRILGFGGT